MYSYYDYLRDYYAYWDSYYDDYYENIYWPKHYQVYNISNDSWCDYLHHHNMSHNNNHYNNSNVLYSLNTTHSPLAMTTLESTQFMTTLFNCTPRYNGTFPPSLYEWDKWWYTNIDIIGTSMVFIAGFLSILGMIIAVIFFIQLKGAMKKVNRPDVLTISISCICIFAHVLVMIFDCISFYFWFMHYDWEIYTGCDIVFEVLWIIAKVSIYSLFAYRYYVLQNASINNPTTKKTKTLLFGSIITAIFTQIALEIIHSYYNFDHMMTGYEDADFEMKQRKYLNAAWAVMTMDFVLVCFLGVLIMKTILNLVITINDPTGFHVKDSEFSGQSVVSSTDMSKSKSMTMQARAKKFSVNSWSKRSVSEERKKRSSKQMNLMETTTRIALTCSLALISSLTVQFLWLFMEETENFGLLWTSWLWSFDAITNMSCVYFSMAFAKQHYQRVCADICKCHHCYLWCVMNIISCQTKEQDKEIELGTATGTRNARIASVIDVSDVSPLPK